MYRALNILKMVCGLKHPDVSSIYMNLGLMYQDCELFYQAVDCYQEALYLNKEILGEQHIQIGSC